MTTGPATGRSRRPDPPTTAPDPAAPRDGITPAPGPGVPRDLPAAGRGTGPEAPHGRQGTSTAPVLGVGGEIGPKLRRLREAAGVSLSELARRAGIGKATLSGLELGTRNPTLDTLWSVTAALGVPITALLDAAETAVVRGTAVEAVLLHVFDEPGVTFELYRMTVPPGPAQNSPAHHAGVTEHITVFSGVLRAGPAEAPLLAGPGEHLTWQADVPHVYAAVGDTPVTASLLIRYPR